MKRNFLLMLSLMLCFGFAAARASGQKPSSLPPVPLKVTIQNFDSTGTFCRIRSDCWNAPIPNCPYIDGVDGVSANFDESGNLNISFQDKRHKTRLVYFDYGDPNTGDPSQVFMAPPPGAHVPPYPTGFQNEANVINHHTDTVPFTPLQNMSVGAVQCVGLAVTFQLNGRGWRNNFHYMQNFPNSSITAYGVVTRLDANTWEVEPKASACNPGVATVAELNDIPLSGPGGLTNNGMYYMPFKLTLVKR